MTNQGVGRFLDSEGRVTQWPKKLSDKLAALSYLSTKFDADRTYSESEVNSVLKTWHTFDDWALLRRDLVEQGYLSRDRDGTSYVCCDNSSRTAMNEGAKS